VQDVDVLEAITLVEDGDLWRWQLPGSKAFYAALRDTCLEYDVNKNPAVFDTLLQLSTAKMISQARTMQIATSAEILCATAQCKCLVYT
jgi:hypothetical protein